MTADSVALPSPCRRCGGCCRAISIDFYKRELRELARREADRLARESAHRHRREIERLLRDVAFIDRHFRRVSRRHAVALNPALAAPDYDGRRFYTCDQLDDRGRCLRHAERPYVCEGYPWYLGSPSAAALVCTPCGYEAVLASATQPGGGAGGRGRRQRALR